MEFHLNDQNSLRVVFNFDYPIERTRYAQLEWLCEGLHIRFLRSGNVVNYRPPYRTVSVITIRNPHVLDEQWQSLLTWCADNVSDVTKTGEPCLVFRMRELDSVEEEMAGWCKLNGLAYTFSAFNVVDANTFDTIALSEFVFEKPNEAIFFKLRWSDWFL